MKYYASPDYRSKRLSNRSYELRHRLLLLIALIVVGANLWLLTQPHPLDADYQSPDTTISQL